MPDHPGAMSVQSTAIAKVGYRTYSTARLDRPSTGMSHIKVQCSNGEACDITMETATSKVLDIQGDSGPFIYWEENVKGGK